MIWEKLHFWGQNMDLLYLNATYMPFVSKLITLPYFQTNKSMGLFYI